MKTDTRQWFEVFACNEDGVVTRDPFTGAPLIRCGHRHRSEFEADQCHLPVLLACSTLAMVTERLTDGAYRVVRGAGA